MCVGVGGWIFDGCACVYVGMCVGACVCGHVCVWAGRWMGVSTCVYVE